MASWSLPNSFRDHESMVPAVLGIITLWPFCFLSGIMTSWSPSRLALPNPFQQGAKYREGLAAPSMLLFSSSREGMAVRLRLGALITSPIRGCFRQVHTLRAPLGHACRFTSASMARLGCRIYLSSNVVHIGFPFNRILFDRRILHTSHDVSATFSLT